MRYRITNWAALALVLTTAACDGTTADTPGTDETTSDLLASLPSQSNIDGMETGALPPGSPRVAAPQQQELDVALLGFDRGVDEAPIRVVEMSDYGCGYCRKFHQETWPVLLEEFIETGKVEWKFLPFLNGMFENSPAALSAAECVLGQGADLFVPMHSAVWTGQSEWKSADEPAPMLRGWAEEGGADMAQYDSCLSEGRRDDRIAAAVALSRQLGVRGTPTFFVVGYPPLQGALPTETFTQILDLVYAEATGAPGG
jgi:protein-disulfide isomerase